jgi:hypothetical protein
MQLQKFKRKVIIKYIFKQTTEDATMTKRKAAGS